MKRKKRNERQEEIECVMGLIQGILDYNNLAITTREGVPIVIWDYEEHKGYALLEKEKE